MFKKKKQKTAKKIKNKMLCQDVKKKKKKW